MRKCETQSQVDLFGGFVEQEFLIANLVFRKLVINKLCFSNKTRVSFYTCT